MRQLTLATGTFETHRKPTCREKFLADMEKVVPWQDLCAVIAPYYPQGETGRPPVGLEQHAAYVFPPTVVQSLRSGGGRSPI